MFRVLTVAREYGGGGSRIAQRAADMLGWNLLDRTLLGAVARAAQVDPETVGRYDEHVDSWWRRFNRGGLRAAAIEAGITPADAQFFDATVLTAFAQQVIAQAAEAGDCVIVGRGAQCVLRDRGDAFHVFIYGPWRERVRRVRSREQPVPDIGDLIRLTDEDRANYIRTYYGCDWKDPHLYHMMVSSEIGVETAARTIVDAVAPGWRA